MLRRTLFTNTLEEVFIMYQLTTIKTLPTLTLNTIFYLHHNRIYEPTESSLWFTPTSIWLKFCFFIELAMVFWTNYNLSYSFMSESNECCNLRSCWLHLLSRRVSSELNSLKLCILSKNRLWEHLRKPFFSLHDKTR